MAKSPSERYRTCGALIHAAEAALGIRARSRGRKGLLAALLVAAAAAAVATPLLLRGGDARPAVVGNSLVKIDLDSDKVVDVVPVGRIPSEIESVGKYVFAASEGDGTLTRVDSRRGDVVYSGRFEADAGLAAEGDDLVWVASLGRREVALVDPRLPIIDPGATSFPVPHVPLARYTTGTSLAVGGGSLWIATSGAGSGPVVERWRLHPLALQRTYRLRAFDYGISVALGYGAAWVALGAPADAVLRIDARSGRAKRIAVGQFPTAVATGFGSVWVVQRGDDTVRRTNPVTGRTQRAVSVGSVPLDVAVGPKWVWVTNHCDGTVSRIDPATNHVVKEIKLGFHPYRLAIGGGFAWVGVTKDVYFGTCP